MFQRRASRKLSVPSSPPAAFARRCCRAKREKLNSIREQRPLQIFSVREFASLAQFHNAAHGFDAGDRAAVHQDVRAGDIAGAG